MALDNREKLQMLELQEQVANYSYDLQQMREAHARQNTIIAVMGIGLALVVVASVVFMRTRGFRRKEVEQLRETARKAQESLENREKFVAFVNHEIRTPLNAVSGSATLLQKTRLDERQEKYVQTIRASVDNVLVLVNDVLDLSRAESGKVEFRNIDFILRELLNGIGYILQEKVESKGIALEVSVADDVPEVLSGDAAHLNQILLNLANNAVKFTDLGKVSLLVDVLSDEGELVWIRFRVADTGKGIRKSKLLSIFNQYEQDTRHTIKHSGGSGLGLAITQQLVEKQGGRIYADSKFMEGSVFTVELAFKKGNLERAMRGRRPDAADPEVLNSLHVLVVDDNEMNREILRDLLVDLNARVKISVAEKAEDAYKVLMNGDVGVVLMDLQMPEVDGFAAARHIRNKLPQPVNAVPIIAMTAHALEDVATRCFEAGMNDYIAKPVDLSFLTTKLQRLKERTQAAPVEWKYINLAQLSELAGGNQDKMMRYISIFSEQAPGDLAELRQALSKEDWDAASGVLHKVKGTVSYFGDTVIASCYARFTSMNLTDNAKKELIEEAATHIDCVMKEAESIRRDHKLLFLANQSKE
jgi:signal transduction histidine kinase/DNA-binding response OmpR family regulator